MAAVRASLITACLVALSLSTARADYSLQDFGINTNGTVVDAGLGGSPFSVSGVSATAFNQATGLGTLTYTFNPGAAGTYYVDFFVDPQAGVPYYNEYGVVGGTAGSGVSSQIDDSYAGTIFANFEANSFDNKNDLPGQTSNYDQTSPCVYTSGGSCNGDTALGLGFSFTLTATQEAIFTLNGSSSGYATCSTSASINAVGCLEDVHPVDPANTSAADYFLSTTESIQASGTQPPPPPATPEPASELLAGGGLLFFGLLLPKLRRGGRK